MFIQQVRNVELDCLFRWQADMGRLFYQSTQTQRNISHSSTDLWAGFIQITHSQGKSEREICTLSIFKHIISIQTSGAESLSDGPWWILIQSFLHESSESGGILLSCNDHPEQRPKTSRTVSWTFNMKVFTLTFKKAASIKIIHNKQRGRPASR